MTTFKSNLTVVKTASSHERIRILNTHTPSNPRCALIFPAGAWLARCPGASLREALCLSQCTEVTSPLSLRLAAQNNVKHTATGLWHLRRRKCNFLKVSLLGNVPQCRRGTRMPHIQAQDYRGDRSTWKMLHGCWACWVTESFTQKPSLVQIRERFRLTFQVPHTAHPAITQHVAQDL